MPLTPHRRALVGHGLALIAMLMIALAPTLTRFAATHGFRGGEICTANGTMAVPADGVAIESPHGAPDGFGHAADCSYCVLQAFLAQPALHGPAIGRLLAWRERPAAFFDAPRALWIWAAKPARGPPRFV